MQHRDFDTGIIIVILDRFEKQRLPWMLDMQRKMELGVPLNDIDIEFLSSALDDIRNFMPYMERNPEFKPLLAKVIHYYKLITDKALTIE
jgi:hypothetical protein